MKRYFVWTFIFFGFLAHSHAQAQTLTADQTETVKQIEADTAELRGLPFKKAVKYVVMEKAGLLNYLQKNFREDATAEEMRHKSRALQALGLVPPGFDLEKEMLALLGEQIGAFYDHKTKTVTTFKDMPLGKGFQRVLLAHELVHALQDQYFDFSKHDEMTLKNNDDRQRAFQALFEGDATFIMPKALMKRINPNTIMQEMQEMMADNSRQSKQLDAAPPFLRDSLMFPYTGGNEFVTALYAQTQDYSLINKTFEKPPLSTAQILHPQKYLDKTKHAAPMEISLGRLSSVGNWVAASKWKVIDDNVLGEFGIRELFATYMTEPKPKSANPLEAASSQLTPLTPECAAAAEGWAGDRYNVYLMRGEKDSDGLDPIGVWWLTEWETEADAAEFTDMMQKVFLKRFSHLTAKETVEARATYSMTWECAAWRIQLTRAGNKVTLIQATPAQFDDFLSRVKMAK